MDVLKELGMSLPELVSYRAQVEKGIADLIRVAKVPPSEKLVQNIAGSLREALIDKMYDNQQVLSLTLVKVEADEGLEQR